MAKKKYQAVKACYQKGRYYSRGDVAEFEDEPSPSLFRPYSPRNDASLVFDPNSEAQRKMRIDRIMKGHQPVNPAG